MSYTTNMNLETLLPELNPAQRKLLFAELVKLVEEAGGSTFIPIAKAHDRLRAEVIGRLEAFCLGKEAV